MEIKSGTNQSRCFRILEKTQWLNRDQIELLQYNSLKAILRHTYANVPFYRQRFKETGIKPEDIKSINQLVKFPKLTKADIRSNFHRMISTSTPVHKLVPNATGGSTGEPLKFAKDKRTISWANAAVVRNYSWAGLEAGDKYVSLWGSPFDISLSRKLSGFLKNLFERHRMLPSSEMSERSMAQYAKIIRSFKPKAIKGYASALAFFARYLERQGICDLNLHSVISTAEKLFSQDREIIQKQFNCEVYDTYGSREFAIMAGECREHIGYHVSSETVLLEFVKDNEHVSPGDLGEILVTDLQNYGMPLIRYAIGDAGIPCEGTCSCGRGLPLIGSISGRVTDFIRAHNGKYISGPGLTLIFSDLSVRRYQIVQRSLDRFFVRIVREPDYSDKDDKAIVSRMKEVVGEDAEIIIQHFSSIPKSPRSGKYRFIISEVPLFDSDKRVMTFV